MTIEDMIESPVAIPASEIDTISKILNCEINKAYQDLNYKTVRTIINSNPAVLEFYETRKREMENVMMAGILILLFIGVGCFAFFDFTAMWIIGSLIISGDFLLLLAYVTLYFTSPRKVWETSFLEEEVSVIHNNKLVNAVVQQNPGAETVIPVVIDGTPDVWYNIPRENIFPRIIAQGA